MSEVYIAEVGYEKGDEFMHGTVVNARAVLHFSGKAVFAAFCQSTPIWGFHGLQLHRAHELPPY